MAAKEYKPISGVKNRWYAANKVYASPHGILLVKVGMSEESYRKLAFSDICGFSITRSARYAAYNFIFGPLVLIFGAVYYFQDFELPVFGGLAALCLGGLVLNLVKGKSCRCVLSSKFSHARVRAITRTRSAVALAEFIKAEVVAVQGELKPFGETPKAPSEETVDTESEASAV